MPIAILTLQLQLPECYSLKDKRGRIKPLLLRLHREFNISIAEIGSQDKWGETQIVAVSIGNEKAHLTGELEKVREFIKRKFPDLEIVSFRIEVI